MHITNQRSKTMKKLEIFINYNGWTTLQEADAKNHVLEVGCRAEDGVVVEVRVRHNDGEEKQGEVKLDGAKVLPMAAEEFKAHFLAGDFEIK